MLVKTFFWQEVETAGIHGRWLLYTLGCWCPGVGCGFTGGSIREVLVHGELQSSQPEEVFKFVALQHDGELHSTFSVRAGLPGALLRPAVSTPRAVANCILCLREGDDCLLK